MMRVPTVVWLSLAATACSGGPAREPGPRPSTSAVVYGSDDRLDAWVHPDADLRLLATSTAVALIRPSALRFADTGAVEIRAAPLSAWDTFCAGTPFTDQPTAALCGGVLIDDDLVVTAGHCLVQEQSCRDVNFVLGYFESAPNTLAPVLRQNVYGCRRIAAMLVSPPDSAQQIDFAVVQLDRAVAAPVAPATIGAARILDVGEPLTVIGFPSGLPLKIDSGAVALDPRAPSSDFFTLASDTFNGSSGSGIYDGARTLVGVFAHGTADTIDRGSCQAVRTVPDGASESGESATYATRAVSALCAAGWPSQRLCGSPPVCGDGVCSPATEDALGCAIDCPPATCGDALCETSEWTGCPADCGDRRPTGLPDGWICDPIWYGDGSTCDCKCGAPDPDCTPSGRTRPCDSTGPAGIKVAASGGGGGCALATGERSHDPGTSSPFGPGTLLALLGIARVRRPPRTFRTGSGGPMGTRGRPPEPVSQFPQNFHRRAGHYSCSPSNERYRP